MAATFVVEDGTGKTDANSYASVAGADLYHENYGNSTSWMGSSQAQKEEALRAATQYLDARYCLVWSGHRKTEDQALAWPRSWGTDLDSYEIDSETIPAALAGAAAELALRYRIAPTDILPDVGVADAGLKSTDVTIGPIRKAVEYQGGKATAKSFPKVDLMLRAAGLVLSGDWARR